MYGYFDPVLVYGFATGRDYKLDLDWLNETFPDLECFALDVVKFHVGNSVYGFQVHYDNKPEGIVPDVVNCPDHEKRLKQLHDLRVFLLKQVEKGNLCASFFRNADEFVGDDSDPKPTVEQLSAPRYYLALRGAYDDAARKTLYFDEEEDEDDESADEEEEEDESADEEEASDADKDNKKRKFDDSDDEEEKEVKNRV